MQGSWLNPKCSGKEVTYFHLNLQPGGGTGQDFTEWRQEYVDIDSTLLGVMFLRQEPIRSSGVRSHNCLEKMYRERLGVKEP